MTIQSGRYLFQVMTPVDLVEAPPLLCGEGSEYRMLQNPRRFTESPLHIDQHRIHGHQRVVEAPQRLFAEARGGNGMLRSLNAGWEASQSQNIDASDLLLEGSAASLDLT